MGPSDLSDLEAQVRYHRERLALYHPRTQGAQPPSSARLAAVERGAPGRARARGGVGRGPLADRPAAGRTLGVREREVGEQLRGDRLGEHPCAGLVEVHPIRLADDGVDAVDRHRVAIAVGGEDRARIELAYLT